MYIFRLNMNRKHMIKYEIIKTEGSEQKIFNRQKYL